MSVVVVALAEGSFHAAVVAADRDEAHRIVESARRLDDEVCYAVGGVAPMSFLTADVERIADFYATIASDAPDRDEETPVAS